MYCHPSSATFELAWTSAGASTVNTIQSYTRTDDIGARRPALLPAAANDVGVSTSFAVSTHTLQEQWEMSCLPERSFDSPEEAQRALNNHAQEMGYAVVHKSTYKNKKNERRRVVYACDRHGSKRKNTLKRGVRRRNVASRKRGCPMGVSVVRVGSGAVWGLQHRSRSRVHNHPPSTAPASHPAHRRAALSATLQATIATDRDKGTRAAQTLARIYQEAPNAPIVARDVYNERARAGTEALDNLSRVEYLLRKLQTGDYFVAYKMDPCSRLSHLFFAFNGTQAIYRENADVLLMDCTYRTNRFNMPLLNIMGISGMNTTIHVSQVFLSGETAADDTWALRQLRTMSENAGIELPYVIFVDRDLALLNALEEVFIGVHVLLCIWHVVKDVEMHARKHAYHQVLDEQKSKPRAPKYRDSSMHRLFCDAFLAVVNSQTEAEYTSRRQVMHAICPSEAAYVDDVWLDIWRYRLVKCWTDRITHVGVQATSRVEGYHSALKTPLGSSSSDHFTIHQRISHWRTQSTIKYRVGKSDAEIKIVSRLRGPMYARVVQIFIGTHFSAAWHNLAGPMLHTQHVPERTPTVQGYHVPTSSPRQLSCNLKTFTGTGGSTVTQPQSQLPSLCSSQSVFEIVGPSQHRLVLSL